MEDRVERCKTEGKNLLGVQVRCEDRRPQERSVGVQRTDPGFLGACGFYRGGKIYRRMLGIRGEKVGHLLQHWLDGDASNH